MNGDIALDWGVFEIIWINILLSGDNAILIALACQQLAPRQRRWGVFLGALGGVVLRVVFTLVIVQIMGVPLLKTVGGLLLLGVAVKLLIDETDHSHVKVKPNLWGAVGAIITADTVMSLDNVLAIAAAAHGSNGLIVFGLVLSVPIVMFGAGALMEVLDRYPALVWAGAGLLGWVAGDMIANDPFWTHPGDVDHAILEKGLSVLGLVIVIVSARIAKKLQNQTQD